MNAVQSYEAIGQVMPGTIAGQLFGKPCFKINGKAFICFFREEMVFKLNGPQHRSALSLEGSSLFDPSGKGRPMKEWVQVPFQHRDQWAEYARAALDYVKQ
ncbi:MAG: hypothetical protein JNM21_11070 [Taibaiella sp.]|nr:hypothetical protein [Taibaiella sp.]